MSAHSNDPEKHNPAPIAKATDLYSVSYGAFDIERGTVASGLTRVRLNQLPEWLAARPGTFITRLEKA